MQLDIGISFRELEITVVGMLRRLINQAGFKLCSYSKFRLYVTIWDIWCIKNIWYLTAVHMANFHNTFITCLTDQGWSLVQLA